MSPAIFTPGNEPYLGSPFLKSFDEILCECFDLNTKCASASHVGLLSEFQQAACILVPQTTTLACSIRELIRQGYLFGAKVLVRPFTERAVTFIYLSDCPTGLQIWNEGWKHGKRPTLQKMFEYLNETKLRGRFKTLQGITFELNSATHGDPFSAKWNVVMRDGKPVFLPSKNLKSPGLADEICQEVVPWLAITMKVMSFAFGQPAPDIAVPVAAGS